MGGLLTIRTVVVLALAAAVGSGAVPAAAQEEPPPSEVPDVDGEAPAEEPPPDADGEPVAEVDVSDVEPDPEEDAEPPDGSPDAEEPADAAAPAVEPAPIEEPEVAPAEPVEALEPPPATGTEEVPEAVAPPPEAPEVPWRGSELELRNAVGLIGLDPSAELTHNPYYTLGLSFRPRWWLGDVLNLRARFDLVRELTDADDTTYANETVVQDMWVGVGASKLYTIPVVEIDVSPDFRLTLPTSKVSRARTLVMALAPGVALRRAFSFDDAGDLSVGYSARFAARLHTHTTSELETPLVPGCSVSTGGCDAFLNTGVRNARYRFTHGIDVSYDTPLEWLGLSAGYLHIVDWLYPIENDDPRVSYEAGPNTDTRYRSAFTFEVTFSPIDLLVIGLGYEAVSPQQAPDSTYYNPLFNRYSTAYLDLRLQAEAVVERIRGIK